MEENLPEEQSALVVQEVGKTLGIDDHLHTTYTGADQSTLRADAKQRTLNPSSADTDASGNWSSVDTQFVPEINGGENCPAKSFEIQREGSKKADCLSGADCEQEFSKTDSTNQPLIHTLHEVKDYDHMKRSDRVCSESPYDTDCTKNLISTIQSTSSQEALLEEIESELLSTDLLRAHKPPNGVCKSESALAVFEKYMQDKYLQQEHTIKK